MEFFLEFCICHLSFFKSGMIITTAWLLQLSKSKFQQFVSSPFFLEVFSYGIKLDSTLYFDQFEDNKFSNRKYGGSN